MQGTPLPRSAGNPVRVFSVPTFPPAYVNFLGGLGGLITHFVKKGQKRVSVYCPGKETCPTATHRGGSIFKAYAPALIWQQDSQVWRPFVFEATANLEQYLNGRTLRGEVWLMSRFDEKAKNGEPPSKYAPVIGAYIERIPESELIAAFPVEPILTRFFGVDEVVLGVANPMAKQVVMEDVIGAPPALPEDLQPAPTPQEDPTEREKLRKIMEEGRRRFGHMPGRAANQPPGTKTASNGDGNGHF